MRWPGIRVTLSRSLSIKLPDDSERTSMTTDVETLPESPGTTTVQFVLPVSQWLASARPRNPPDAGPVIMIQ
jgi:hypothetical protein